MALINFKANTLSLGSEELNDTVLLHVKKNKIIDYILKSNLRIALAINSIFFLLLVCFCDFKYEVSDDFIMASIVSGAYGGTPNPHMIFVNVIIGYLLIPLYNICPTISWYFVFQLLLLFSASTLVVYFLLCKLETSKATMLAMIFLLFFTGDAYILMQFTKTAMFAVIVGGLIFIWSLFTGQKQRIAFFSAILCLFGSMLRFEVIYIAGGFIVFVLIYEFFSLYKKNKLRIVSAKIFIGGVLLIGGAFALHYVDVNAYDNDTYRYFYEYNSLRAQIVDYQDYGYNAYADALSEIGISENDYKMLKNWNFADNDFYTLDTMRAVAGIIRDHYNSRYLSINDIIRGLQNRGFSRYPIYQACALLLVLGVFLNRRKWWSMLVSIGIGFSYLFYFTYRERCIYRIEYCVFLGMFLCGLYFWNRKLSDVYLLQNRGTCKIIVFLCVISTIMIYIPDNSYKSMDASGRRNYIYNVFNASWNYNTQKMRSIVNKDKPVSNLLSEVSANKQNFYFFDFNTTIQTLYFEWPPWKTVAQSFNDNCSYLTGITSNFPDVNKILEQNNISSSLKNLVNENVYLVDNNSLEMKLAYLQAHYYPGARAELYKEIDGYKIWKVYEQ